MGHTINLTNQEFGHLRVLHEAGRDKWGRATWTCICRCGNTKIVAGFKLTQGQISCGCQGSKARIGSLSKRTHRRSGTKLYRIWAGMINRCDNTNDVVYPRYGGRGIKVVDRWRNFANFLKDMGECPNGCSLERVDVNGNYSPENCKWATKEEQANNIRKSRKITFQGKTLTISQWAKKLGIKYGTLLQRLDKYKLPIEEALTRPLRPKMQQPVVKRHPLYHTWLVMRNRCNNPNNHDFHRYGGRGIRVCERWDDFTVFVEDMGPKPQGTSLDRIDNDRDYSPYNCRWATKLQQANNTSSVVAVTFNGETHSLSEWARLTGLSVELLSLRYRKGWSPDRILASKEAIKELR